MRSEAHPNLADILHVERMLSTKHRPRMESFLPPQPVVWHCSGHPGCSDFMLNGRAPKWLAFALCFPFLKHGKAQQSRTRSTPACWKPSSFKSREAATCEPFNPVLLGRWSVVCPRRVPLSVFCQGRCATGLHGLENYGWLVFPMPNLSTVKFNGGLEPVHGLQNVGSQNAPSVPRFNPRENIHTHTTFISSFYTPSTTPSIYYIMSRLVMLPLQAVVGQASSQEYVILPTKRRTRFIALNPGSLPSSKRRFPITKSQFVAKYR